MVITYNDALLLYPLEFVYCGNSLYYVYYVLVKISPAVVWLNSANCLNLINILFSTKSDI